MRDAALSPLAANVRFSYDPAAFEPGDEVRSEKGHAILGALAVVTSITGFELHEKLGPPDTFWTVDDAGKALVLDRIARDPSAPWLTYAGAALDPGYTMFPQPLEGAEPYAVRRGERVLSQYHAPFVWLALVPYRAFGDAGRGMWPALGAGAAVLLTGRLAAAVAGPMAGVIAALIAIVASPLLFYAAVFWEHSLTIALAAGAFLALAKSRPMVAGIAFGAATLLREESILLVVAAVGAALVDRKRSAAWRIALGGAVGALSRAGFHAATTGSWLGVHAGLNRSEPFVHAFEAASGLLFGCGFSGLPMIAAVGALILFGSSLGRRSSLSGIAPMLGVAILFAISALGWRGFPGGQDRVLALVRSNSAVLFVPWVFAAPYLSGAAPANLRLPVATSVLFVALFLVLVPERSITGVHPGPRMLLTVLPVAAAVAAARIAGNPRHVFMLMPLFLASAAWSVRSLDLLHAKRAAAGVLAHAIANAPDRIVMTDLFWLPTEMAALWDRKQFHLLRRDADLERLARGAAASGERSMLAAVEPGRIPAEALAPLRPADLPAFSVDLHRLTLRADGTPPDAASLEASGVEASR